MITPRKKTQNTMLKTYPQLVSLEKKGLIVIDWKGDHAILKSHVRITDVSPIGNPPYKGYTVTFQ